MGIKVNSDVNEDFILLRLQGSRVPAPTSLAVDDGENLSGGAVPGGGSNSTGTSGGNTLLTNAQNFAQIQDDPTGNCIAHDTIVEMWRNGHQKEDDIVQVKVQDLIHGQELHYAANGNAIEHVERKWCESLWLLQSGNNFIECSPTQRFITSEDDHAGTIVTELKPGDKTMLNGGLGTINQSRDTGRGGWVYDISLADNGSPQDHWFIANTFVAHNVKRNDL